MIAFVGTLAGGVLPASARASVASSPAWLQVAGAVVLLNRDADRRREAAAGGERFAEIEGLQHERVPAAGARCGRKRERSVAPHEHHERDAGDRHEQTDQDERDPEPELQPALHAGHPPTGGWPAC